MLGFLPCHVNVMSTTCHVHVMSACHTVIPVVPGDKLWIDGACLLNSLRVFILDHERLCKIQAHPQKR
jgi:hypothetical protein